MLKIGDFSSLAQVSIKTLRYYDERGLLSPAHIDPETGARTVVFSCFNQDQALDRVDFPALHERLLQNGTHEKLTAQWIDRALQKLGARAAVV